MRWAKTPRPGRPRRERRRSPLGIVLPPIIASGALVLLDLPIAAVIAGLVGGSLAVAIWLRPSVSTAVAEFLGRIGKAAGRGVSVVLLGFVHLILISLVAVLARLFHHDPLGTDGSWSGRAGPTSVRRTFGADGSRSSPRHRGLVLLPQAVGLVVLLAAANYGAGWLWDEHCGSHDMPADQASLELSAAELAIAPAIVDEPWADSYWDEFDALTFDFRPFLLSRLADVSGAHINSQAGIRRSYRAAGAGLEVREVWFFGGTALWGAGQRDLHTVPSEIARLAEEDGVVLRVVNFAQPAYTSWQSALAFEQQLAVRPAPDAVVFYDGADDLAVQVERPSSVPSHYNVDGISTRLTGRGDVREQLDELVEDYRDTSVLNRLMSSVTGVLGADPAAAQGPDELAERTLDVHRRSVDLAAYLADRDAVPSLFAWQAAAGVAGDGGTYREMALDDDRVLDLRGALDDDAVYLDGVLVNETGARAIADRLWEQLRDLLPAATSGSP